MTIDQAIDQTLALWRETIFAWGQSDCLLSVADYCSLLTGTDIGAPWRGTYQTSQAALRIVSRAGGAVALLGSALTSHGLLEVDPADVTRGDAVIVEVGPLKVGGLYTGDGFTAVRAERGVQESRFRIIGAWRWVG